MSNNTEHLIRFFCELTDEEADAAVGKIRQQLVEDYDTGRIDLTFDYRTEADLQDFFWDTAGAIAENAVFIPDDGTYVVRL